MIFLRKAFFVVAVLLWVCFLSAPAAGGASPGEEVLPPFLPTDRVLILAPHPDDEAIATSGVIQRCIQNNIPLKIVYFTNGDNNELSFVVYEKRLVFRKKAFVYMGEVRRKEAVRAMEYLGLSEENLTFLGYPDFGTMEIFSRYWNPARPMRSMMTRVTAVPYKDSLSFGAPYAGPSVVKDLKKVITDFRPTKISVSHPADTNRDHRALNLFLRVVLWDLEGAIEPPQVYTYLVHVVRWPMPRGFRPSLGLSPPKNLADVGIKWQDLVLTDKEVWNKRGAISFYRSQLAYAPSYLYTFARKDELFDDFPDVHLSRKNTSSLQWQDIRIYPEMDEATEKEKEISDLSYAVQGQDLMVRLALRHRFNKNFGIFLYLFGYRKDVDFAEMPKIRISVGMRGAHVWDKLRRLRTKDVTLAYEGKALIVKVPLTLLGGPDRILACAKTSSKDLPLDNTAWRIVFLDDGA
ncbi:MAG: PIG-L family deacetylase [Candidatus Omnitrophota bacterium]|jgi:LmbE family N-acetylglucosaminyl deacetylase